MKYIFVFFGLIFPGLNMAWAQGRCAAVRPLNLQPVTLPGSSCSDIKDRTSCNGAKEYTFWRVMCEKCGSTQSQVVRGYSQDCAWSQPNIGIPSCFAVPVIGNPPDDLADLACQGKLPDYLLPLRQSS